MNTSGSEIKIFTGNAHKELAADIAKELGVPLGDAEVGRFSDGEISVNINETVRGVDAFIIQPTCSPVNGNIMELLIMIDAFKRASAGRITAVIPYYGYARQDRKAKARDPITAKLVANLITAAGADRVLTMDLHAAQIQGYFDIPLDHLHGGPILAEHFKKKNIQDLVVVSPDLGSVGRARTFAEQLDAPLAIIDKRRPKANVSEVMNIIGDVKDKNVILIDDMIDTAGTLVNGAEALKKLDSAQRKIPRRAEYYTRNVLLPKILKEKKIFTPTKKEQKRIEETELRARKQQLCTLFDKLKWTTERIKTIEQELLGNDN